MLGKLNKVIDYIEDHLADDLSSEMISEYAGVSDYHSGRYSPTSPG